MTSTSAAVAAAYDALADTYDQLTEGYDYETWLTGLVRAAERHGLRGRRVLDVACGTGKSFAPMLARGYSVTGCDVSAEMLRHARARAGSGVRLEEADMCALPALGPFDLITCLDDSLNYVLEPKSLRGALCGMRRVLAPDGLIVLDVNSLLTYRTSFAETWVRPSHGAFIAWQGHASPLQAPETVADATITVFRSENGATWARSESEHRQRHWSPSTLREVAERSGLEAKEVLGQLPGAVLEQTLDESRHHKFVLVLGASAEHSSCN